MAEAQNIPVGSTTAGQIAVAAESTVATRMSAPPSFDVAGFPVPDGGEEEWRSAPVERLRGLHDGTAVANGTGVKVDVQAPEGVTVETVGRDDARIDKSGTPVDRVAAQAYSAFEKAGVITVPKETVLTEPIRIAVHGEGGTAYAHQVVEPGAFAEAVVSPDANPARREPVPPEPIRIAVHGEGGTAYAHQVVELGAFAEAVVV